MTTNETQSPGPWLIGNWKMHGDLNMLEAFEAAIKGRFGYGGKDKDKNAKLGLAVPDLLLYPAMGILSHSPIEIGIQTCSHVANGAHTGETSAQLAADLGAKFAIVGHSERRQDQGESNEQVFAKAQSAQAAGLIPIICVGETLQERESGGAQDAVYAQVQASCPKQGVFFIAYEPVWAIGTGQVASPEDAQAMHASIRQILPNSNTPILYGGSMKPENAGALLSQPDIDGGLIGGASLNPQDLLAIYDARP